MLKSKNRLNVSLADSGFKTLKKGRFFSIKVRKNNLNFNRVGIIVSKKYSLRATARNALKRLVFKTFSEIEEFTKEGSSESYDILVIILTKEEEMVDNRENFVKEIKNIYV